MNTFLKSRIFSIIFILISFSAFCQLNQDIEALGELKLTQPVLKQDYSEYRHQTGTVRKIFAGMFFFYKRFVSSQDVSSCPFNPSCSVFFISSVQKKGAFIGFLAGIDRYMRCNGKSNDRYEIEHETNKLHDPIEN